MESTKKEKVDKNHPEVIDANSPGNLLFDDEEENKEAVDEVTASAGGAGAGAYQTPGAFAKGGDFDDEMKDSPEKKNIHEELQKRFEETPYAKKDKKRTLKREGNPDGWTTVELEPGSGYVPKGMNKNYALGLHGAEVNSKEEDKLSKGSPKGRAAMNESFDPGKKKFITESEHKELGVNKRYIITHKLSKDEEANKWAKLANFERNSTIRLAESCGCPVDDGTKEKMVSREQGEQENEREFMQRNNNVDAGDTLDGKEIVVVAKPGSLSGAEFKVFKDDYINESKAFILDLNTGNLVNNPNYKRSKTIAESVEDKPVIKESVKPAIKESNTPNTAYYYNTELGKLVRNPNYKA